MHHRNSAGGMGDVYRALDESNRVSVAIKTIQPRFLDDPQIQSMFHREGRLLRKCAHQGVVGFIDFFVDQDRGVPVLVMEHIRGSHLTQHIEQGPMSKANTYQLLFKLVEALVSVHDSGAIHRDIKPDNILLDENCLNSPKLIDFGLARSMDEETRVMGDDQFAGNLAYLAPEQIGGFGGQVDERADIFSLGMLAVSCLRGEVFEAKESARETLTSRKAGLDLSDIGVDLQVILERMTAPNPNDRPISMEAVTEQLSDIKFGQSNTCAETGSAAISFGSAELNTAPPTNLDD